MNTPVVSSKTIHPRCLGRYECGNRKVISESRGKRRMAATFLSVYSRAALATEVAFNCPLMSCIIIYKK